MQSEDYASVGSRVTDNDGPAVLAAAEELRRKCWWPPPESGGRNQIPWSTSGRRSGVPTGPGSPSRSKDGPDRWRASGASSTVPPHDPSRVRDHAEPSRPCPTFAGQAALVSVDRETGRILVEKVISVHKIGREVNPAEVEGKVEGRVVFGLWQALFEGVQFQEGEILNPTFLRLPYSGNRRRAPSPNGAFGKSGRRPLRSQRDWGAVDDGHSGGDRQRRANRTGRKILSLTIGPGVAREGELPMG